jgi:signal transduction histidine kinase
VVAFADTPLSKLRQLNPPLGWAVLFVACGLLVVHLQPAGTPVLWYPPIAIGVGCLLRSGLRYWPVVFVADLIVSIDQYGFATDAAVVSASTTLEAISVVLILHIRSRSFGISDHRDLAWLVLACVAGTFAGASVGSVVLEMLEREDSFTWSMWLTWGVGDGMSAVSLLPLILVLSERAEKTGTLGSSRAWDWESIATIVSALAIAYVTFAHLPILLEHIQEAIEPLIFLPVLWAAVRLGTRTTCIAILGTALSVVLFHLWASALGAGPAGPGVLEIHCFLVALTIVGLSLALALDRERHQRIEAQAQAAQLRQATDDLRAASMRLELAAKSANLAVWDWNLEDNSLVWDDQVYAMYQIDLNTKDKYEAWLQRLHPDDRARLLAEIDGAIARGEDVSSNFRIVLPDGDERYVNTHGIVHASAGGKATRIIGIDYDVTELVRQRLKAEASELQAATANRAKSEFLAIMSHELRTPLNAIIGFSDIMVREAFGPLQNQRYSDYVNDIRNSGQLLLSLINDILDLTRIEAGKLELNLEPIGPDEILDDIVRLLAPLAHTRNLTLAVQEARYCPPLLADRRALRQLLNNLVANGIKFTDPGGAVTLSAEPANGARVALLVADNGRGIPRERIAELCRPFVQIQDSLRRDVGGLGLGLAISRSLAEVMGGSLVIDSDLGQGTIVRVILPVAKQT